MLRQSMIRNRARAGFHPSGRLNTGSRLESNLGSGVLLPFLFEKKKKHADRRLSRKNLCNADVPHMRQKN